MVSCWKGLMNEKVFLCIVMGGIMEQIIKKLTEEIKFELFHYPVTSKKQDVKYWIKRLIVPQNTPKRDSFFWPQAMLAQALESAGEIETLKEYREKENIDLFVFIVYDMTNFYTKVYKINDEIEIDEYFLYASRGNTIIPDIVKKYSKK